MVKQALFIAVCVAGLGLQACNNSTADPAQMEADVQKAKAEGEKKIVEAQAKLEQVAAENKKDVVVAQADARIDAANDLAAKAGDSAKKNEAGKPGAKKPEAGEPTPPPADENIAKARVTAMQKVADAQYGVDKAKAEATYGVTLARCKGQSSESMQTICRDGAQKTLASAVASAKARSDAARRRAAMAQTSGQNG
ncbi:MAG TPA: hypothetical protein VFE67_19485 [Rudaea sp.]|jgi:hypothetical protein|nr:hypothetical protein [Rudaea sp.]